jgi:adenylate cyclase
MERKLTAILSADVKGYSRLMGEDEEATIRTLTVYREVMATLIARHRGRVVDSPGDNLLAEFASAVDAVQGAVKIQQDLHGKNAELPPERRMEFRIGINVGDVVVEGERLYGDGVNIAARLEALAEGGGICIAGTVYDQVENKLSLSYEYVGEQMVKNIAKPVRVYRVRREMKEPTKELGKDEVTSPASTTALSLPDKPSIIVLPFLNMSNDPEQEYFSDGITEDLTTDLSRIAGLFVISRNSAFTYKGKAAKAQDISREMGVRYLLEGSVRKAGERIRITAQLIDATTDHHLWAERYDCPLQDLFALQDEIVQKIVTTLRRQLTLRHLFSATPQAVFDAWLDPESLREWMCPGELTVGDVQVDARTGGAFRLVMRGQAGEVVHTGEYREICPPERLMFTWRSHATH